MIDVVEFSAKDADEWRKFLQASNNGTLFHDLDFLAYHPPARFNMQHLLFHQGDKLIALLPAAIVSEQDGRRFLTSPEGASVGGFVLPLGQSAETTIAVIASLKEYVRASKLDGVQICIGPSVYLREPNQHLSFGFMANDFHLARSWLCHIIPLPENPDRVLRQCKPAKARDMRAGLRKGCVPLEAGHERIREFYELLSLTQTKHGAAPTHRREEIEDLFRRVPGRIRLFLCDWEGRALSGILLFVLNSVVAYTFYICQDDARGEMYATTVLMVHVAQQTASEGLRFLDLGPSTFNDLSLNCGLAFFKEGFGARGFCRETWRWVVH